MLRGINVGGHNKIKMDVLRALYESLGLRNVRSHLQSGNVIFESEHSDRFRLAAQIENSIEKVFGFRPKIIFRTCAELKEVIGKNPFSDSQDRDPSRLHVMFLLSDPGNEAKESLQRVNTAPEELHMIGQEIYLYYLNGMGRSKLTSTLIEKKLKIYGTARNWNTVTKLLEVAEAISAS
jgi:uncharacterized protein (DUF1697 family)